MFMQFRTRQNTNGQCLYLALDTDSKTYSTDPRAWISKDIPELKTGDLRTLVERVAAEGWTQVPNM